MTRAVKVECYGKVREYETRQQAIEHFAQCIFCCEGSEQQRYTNILSQLIQGKDYCTDTPIDN